MMEYVFVPGGAVLAERFPLGAAGDSGCVMT